jgi:hypothetical protein
MEMEQSDKPSPKRGRGRPPKKASGNKKKNVLYKEKKGKKRRTVPPIPVPVQHEDIDLIEFSEELQDWDLEEIQQLKTDEYDSEWSCFGSKENMRRKCVGYIFEQEFKAPRDQAVWGGVLRQIYGVVWAYRTVRN